MPMPRPYPLEFRRGVVAVARKHEAPLGRIAKEFGILSVLSGALVEESRQ